MGNFSSTYYFHKHRTAGAQNAQKLLTQIQEELRTASYYYKLEMHYIKILIVLLLGFSMSSCGDSIIQPTENALLDIVVSTNDSLQIDYDNITLVKKKLTYNGSVGLSWLHRFDPAQTGIHKISVTVFDDSIKAERKFYIIDTLTIFISYYPEYEKRVNFSTVNHEWYGE